MPLPHRDGKEGAVVIGGLEMGMTFDPRLGGGIIAAAMFMGCTPHAGAQTDQHKQTYERTVLAAPVSPDPALDAFVEAAAAAFRDWSRNLSGEEKRRAAEALFDDDVVIYSGGMDLGEGGRFREQGRYSRETILEEIGRLTADAETTQRKAAIDGGYVVEKLLSVGAVGANAWLDGEICTGSFGRLSDAEMQERLDSTGTSISDWVVALADSEHAQFHRYHGTIGWVRGELLRIDPDAPPIRSCCWTSVVAPDGWDADVQTGFDLGPLLPYLGSHACFTRRGDGWKISAIAVRAN